MKKILIGGFITENFKKLGRFKLQYTMIGVLAGLWILFIIGSPRTFLSFPIYASYMSTIPVSAIMALALTFVIITGEIDLSFPSIMGFSGWVFTVIFTVTNNIYLALFLCLLTGVIAGFINGVIVVKVGVPSLVATIGTMYFWRGLIMVITKGYGATLVDTRDMVLYKLLVGRVGGKVPAQIIWTVVIAVILWFFLNRHKFGAHIYYIGDNIESSKMMGVGVNLVKMVAFALMGFFAAFSSMISSMEVAYYWPTLGEGYLLRTMSIVFLGGTSVFGGTGTLFGTFIAALIIGGLEAGIVASGLSGFWIQLIYGLIIIISVGIHAQVRKRSPF